MVELNDETAGGLADATRVACDTVHGLAEEQLLHDKTNQRSSTKTRKSALTRQRIMEAASALIMERGNTGFQMSEVSDRCHMSKGSLYYYFRDRDELVGAIFDEYVDDLIAGMEKLAASSGSAREAITKLYSEFSRRLRAGTPLSYAMSYELPRESHSSIEAVTTRFSRAARVIATQLERGKAEGFIRTDVNADAAAVFALGGLIATTMAVATKGTADADDVSASLMSLMLHGVSAEDATLD